MARNDMRNAYTILSRNAYRKLPLGSPSCRDERMIIKIYVKEDVRRYRQDSSGSGPGPEVDFC